MARPRSFGSNGEPGSRRLRRLRPEGLGAMQGAATEYQLYGCPLGYARINCAFDILSCVDGPVGKRVVICGEAIHALGANFDGPIKNLPI